MWLATISNRYSTISRRRDVSEMTVVVAPSWWLGKMYVHVFVYIYKADAKYTLTLI